jgi:ABC-type amino acid transport substrate-binding protein
MRRIDRRAYPLVVLLAAGPLAATDLAPTGTLRATFLGSNPVQGKIDRETGAITGPVADLVKDLARRLNVPYTIMPAPDARGVMDNLKAHKADIGFLAYDPARAAEVDFSRPYALMHNSYIVRTDSDFKTSVDVDRTGARVGAVKGQSQQLYLSENLKNGKVRIFETMPLEPTGSAWWTPPHRLPSCASSAMTFWWSDRRSWCSKEALLCCRLSTNSSMRRAPPAWSTRRSNVPS